MITSTVTLMFIYLTGASKRSMFGFLKAKFTRFGRVRGDAITPNSHYPLPSVRDRQNQKGIKAFAKCPAIKHEIEKGYVEQAESVYASC